METQTGRPAFAPVHKADAVFFPVVLGLIWLGILEGFVPKIVAHFAGHQPYSAILRIHAAVFVGWLLLLTFQLVLIRSHKVALHRRVGQLGVVWMPLLFVIGLVTSIIVDRSKFGTPEWGPDFFAIQLSDLVLFAALTGAALLMRRDPASHKRLMLLGTVTISNAGFARWWDPVLGAWLGRGYVPELIVDFLSDFLILGAMLAYDFATRGRANRALLRAAALVVGIESLAVFVYFNPGWIAFTDRVFRP